MKANEAPEQYIPKSALVAEIERLKNTSLEYGYNTMQKILADSGKDISLRQLQNFLDTLEVKEANEVPATVMVNKYGNRFISSWSGLKEYDDLKEGEEIKILIPKK